MSTALKPRRGSTAEHSSFIGEAGEITVDTTLNTVIVHDGSTAGGFALATSVGGVAALGDVGDVTITSNTDGEVLRWNGSAWVNNTLAELGAAAASHNHAATEITSGTVATARLGSGTADNTTFLRGDQTWAAPTATVSALGDIGDVTITANSSGEVLMWNGSAWINRTLAEAGIFPSAGGTVSGSVVPNADSTLNLGSATYAFAAAYVDGYEFGQTTDTTLTRVAAGRVAVEGVELGYRQLPQLTSTTVDAGSVGKHHYVSAGVTISASTFSVGDAITIANSSAGDITITQGASVTMYLAGSATTGNRTLAQKGVATVLCVGTDTFLISGAGLT